MDLFSYGYLLISLVFSFFVTQALLYEVGLLSFVTLYVRV